MIRPHKMKIPKTNQYTLSKKTVLYCTVFFNNYNTLNMLNNVYRTESVHVQQNKQNLHPKCTRYAITKR